MMLGIERFWMRRKEKQQAKDGHKSTPPPPPSPSWTSSQSSLRNSDRPSGSHAMAGVTVSLPVPGAAGSSTVTVFHPEVTASSSLPKPSSCWMESTMKGESKRRHPSSATSRGDADSITSSSSPHPPTISCPPPVTPSSMTGMIECPLCLLLLPLSSFPPLTSCGHRSCFTCLQSYLRIEIRESRIMISCPECVELIHPNDIRTILNDEEYLAKYERFMLRRVLVSEPDARWCPAPDCGFVVIASGCAGCPKLQCLRPGCQTSFCYHCKHSWHPNKTCDAARAERVPIGGHHGRRGSIITDALESVLGHQKDSEMKPCPNCKMLIIKMDDGSCNHMTCSLCYTEFCWLCMKRISDLHYLSPSGCTFWGKKPWSRKKKILWQLGMLVGAPVGIALIAGIAVPAIIIGIPVWVGRKLHTNFEKKRDMSRKKKNLMIATGVLTSVFVSPILSMVAVGIGIPILLAYVYGVVPISLCRSGCGANPSSSGVRHDPNEETEEVTGRMGPDSLSVDTAISHKVNPSIGEASLGMSASLSMGSHLDGAVMSMAGDRESASNAGLTGSICNRLEVTAEVNSDKRFSFSSHSETTSCGISLSERTSNGAMDDGTSSTRGCAGSLHSARTPHGDVQSHGSSIVVSTKSPVAIMIPNVMAILPSGNHRTITDVEVHVDAYLPSDSAPQSLTSIGDGVDTVSSSSSTASQTKGDVSSCVSDTVILMDPPSSPTSTSPPLSPLPLPSTSRSVSFQPSTKVIQPDGSSSQHQGHQKSRSLKVKSMKSKSVDIAECAQCSGSKSCHRPGCPNLSMSPSPPSGPVVPSPVWSNNGASGGNSNASSSDRKHPVRGLSRVLQMSRHKGSRKASFNSTQSEPRILEDEPMEGEVIITTGSDRDWRRSSADTSSATLEDITF